MPKPSPYQMVDLGLSVKWADRNVGAENIEDYGDYFMWGSTTPDTDNECSFEYAPFNNGYYTFDRAYFSANSGTWLNTDFTLKPEYDAAHAIMGDTWRMPTSVEMQELIDGTTQSVEELNGVRGMRFTSNTNGNSNNIFIPFAGTRVYSDVDGVGDYGSAWSSSLNTVHADCSHDLYFNDDGAFVVDTDDSMRFLGNVVRGVC